MSLFDNDRPSQRPGHARLDRLVTDASTVRSCRKSGPPPAGLEISIESINYQLRKVTKNRGHFPNDDAAIKLLYLALRNMNPERGGDLGTGTYGWKRALNAFAIHFPGRLPL
jgi:hypothetical protein